MGSTMKNKKHGNIANSEKKKARKQYEGSMADKCKADPKNFWKYGNTSLKVENGIGKLDLGNGNTAETDEQKSQALNLFFSYVFQNETDNIQPLNCANNVDGVCLPEVLVSSAAVFNTLRTFDPIKSDGPHRISPGVLLELLKFIYVR